MRLFLYSAKPTGDDFIRAPGYFVANYIVGLTSKFTICRGHPEDVAYGRIVEVPKDYIGRLPGVHMYELGIVKTEFGDEVKALFLRDEHKHISYLKTVVK